MAHNLAAGITLLIGASGLTVLGINSTFWSVVAGVALARSLPQGDEDSNEDDEDR